MLGANNYPNFACSENIQLVTVIPTFFDGFKHKPETTYGNINVDICAFMIPNFQRKNFCDAILESPWNE
ncbi:hypothetical protein [Chitinophaga sp. CF418]|uniref:hypothetical protein n=1 Tax=Chitinophaga sp. CF418 TaxID=1855287 RepID=UPI00091C3940|nr:hypothetical protein [Chitinophaga sp. CF418]SHN36132.1 hypothetical protein SAMN05216311_11061 [Chitinophaga sp. CF418]